MDVLFDSLDADADAPRDLRVSQILHAVEEKNLTPPRRHRFDGRQNTLQALGADKAAFGIRRCVHSVLL